MIWIDDSQRPYGQTTHFSRLFEASSGLGRAPSAFAQAQFHVHDWLSNDPFLESMACISVSWTRHYLP